MRLSLSVRLPEEVVRPGGSHVGSQIGVLGTPRDMLSTSHELARSGVWITGQRGWPPP